MKGRVLVFTTEALSLAPSSGGEPVFSIDEASLQFHFHFNCLKVKVKKHLQREIY